MDGAGRRGLWEPGCPWAGDGALGTHRWPGRGRVRRLPLTPVRGVPTFEKEGVPPGAAWWDRGVSDCVSSGVRAGAGSLGVPLPTGQRSPHTQQWLNRSQVSPLGKVGGVFLVPGKWGQRQEILGHFGRVDGGPVWVCGFANRSR